MNRRLAALGLLAVLLALSGCSGLFGPGEPDQERLTENASYDWETETTASIDVNRSSFTAVYDVPNNTSLDVYVRDDLGREQRLQISALRYRYPNGTVITTNQSTLAVTQTRQRTTIDLPNRSGGQVAFTAPRHGKQFSLPVFREGSYAVRLPPNARVGVPFLSQVSPGDYETSVSEEYMTVRWEEVTTRQIRVRWYLQRDLVLFAAVTVGAVAIGTGGAVYYYRQIRRLKRRREESDIDVDQDDDPRDRGPPPGMR